jgi:hypothetical protein
MPITDPTVATAIINAAKAGNAYKGEMPADDATKLRTADDLVALANQAKEAGVQGGPVMDVLAIAEGGAASAGQPAAPAAPSGKVTIVDQNGTEYEIDATQIDQYVNGSGQYTLKQVAPPVPPTPAPVPTPVATPAPVQQAPEQTTVITQPVPAPTDINQIIPSYDDLKVTDILTVMEGLDEQSIAFVKAYEAAEGERGKIISFERHSMAAPPQAVPQASFGQPSQSGVPAIDPSQYATVEPWQGFAKTKIKDIMENIDRVMRDHPNDAKRVLAHVWEYEKNNKERTSLINKLTALAQQLQGGGVPAPAAPVPGEGGDVQPTPPFASGGPVPPAAPAPAAPANAFVDQGTAIAPQATPQPAPGTIINQPSSGANGLLAPLEGTTQRSTQAIIAENLPIPPEIGAPPVLPADFTTVGDQQVAQLQSQFNACLARAHYLCAVAEGHAADAKIVADGLLREYKAANPVPKGTTVDQHDAQAHAANPQIASARQIQNEWNGHARQLRALADTYQWNCERLSREQTRRSDERRTA